MRLRLFNLCTLLVFAFGSPVAMAGRSYHPSNCAAYLGCLVAGGVCSTEQAIKLPLRVFQAAATAFFPKEVTRIYRNAGQVTKTDDAKPILITDRSALSYFDYLGLHLFDFRGKRVLDIASGKSRFIQTIQALYGWSGTRGKAIDLFASPPLLSFPGTYEKGDAFKLSKSGEQYDLTVNNWMFFYYLSPTAKGEKNLRSYEKAVFNLLDEQLAVTAPNGEARIFIGGGNAGKENASFLKYLLDRHPRVESYDFKYTLPHGRFLAVKMKGENSSQRLAMSDMPPTDMELPAPKWTFGGVLGLQSSLYLAVGLPFILR